MPWDDAAGANAGEVPALAVSAPGHRNDDGTRGALCLSGAAAGDRQAGVVAILPTLTLTLPRIATRPRRDSTSRHQVSTDGGSPTTTLPPMRGIASHAPAAAAGPPPPDP